jgi:hypothetical protein
LKLKPALRGQGVADGEHALVDDAHDVAGISRLQDASVLRHHDMGPVHAHLAAQSVVPSPSCRVRNRPETTRMKRHAVAVTGIHVGLELENIGREGFFHRVDVIFAAAVEVGPAGPVGPGAKSTKASKKGSTPKLVRAEPKYTGVTLPFRKASREKGLPATSSSSRSWFSFSQFVLADVFLRFG